MWLTLGVGGGGVPEGSLCDSASLVQTRKPPVDAVS